MNPDMTTLLPGDILLQDSRSSQGPAIKAATGSDITHCGIHFTDERGQPWVLEAVQPVKRTPLREFILRDPGGKFTALRHRDYPDGLPEEKLVGMGQWLRDQMGKNYDGKFLWDDLRLYCSELVYKAYEAIGIQVCERIQVRDLNLKHRAVQELIQRRFGSMDRVPLEEPIVPPSALERSPYLIVIRPAQP